MTALKKERLIFILLAVLILFVGGYFFVFSEDKQPKSMVENRVNYTENDEPDEEESEETKELVEIVVDIKGAVREPGVYYLHGNPRVENAVQAAGGLTTEADRNQVNFAAPVADGMMIVIPKIGEEQPESLQTITHSQPAKIAINSASLIELQELPGIGPAKAEAIVSFREENGPFKTVNDLLNIPGIGEKSLEKLKEHIKIP